ncbi:MAG: hypothetical protein KatS3mg108_0800 [Isosphaeraceae bacterium]|jgi:hypothetical protein|nr:MAG: hypothetical protein KatS3mg108_0800 [Isosphaeraceae bacterium]
MLVFDRQQWVRHRGWAWLCGLAAVAAIVWCLVAAVQESPWRWPPGSSLPGFTLGVLGGGMILFEMLLWPRKLLRGWRLGRTQCWMAGHLWLGLLCLPLLLLHGGFHFDLGRSTLAAVLMWLLVAVVLSGIWGLVMQHIYPRRMLNELPAETIHAQIPHVLSQFREQARRIVERVCGESADTDLPSEPYLVATATRQSGAIGGRTVLTQEALGRVPGSAPLREFYERQIAPYLEDRPGASPLDTPARAEALFEELERRLPAGAHPAVRFLANLCDQRRQFALQDRWHRRLHAWLAVHFALSLALTVLMLAHIVLALKYF